MNVNAPRFPPTLPWPTTISRLGIGLSVAMFSPGPETSSWPAFPVKISALIWKTDLQSQNRRPGELAFADFAATSPLIPGITAAYRAAALYGNGRVACELVPPTPFKYRPGS
jgi:hypothetical protein